MTRTESPIPSLTLKRILSGTPEEVFDLWTQPKLMVRWMTPYPGEVRCVAKANVTTGGAFSLTMSSSDSECQIDGIYVLVDAPRRLIMTWKGPPTGDAETLLAIDLSPVAGGTELLLTHEKLPTPEIREGHLGGWSNMLDHLEAEIHRQRP